MTNRIDWFIAQMSANDTLKSIGEPMQEYVIDYLEKAKEDIEDLTFTLRELKE